MIPAGTVIGLLKEMHAEIQQEFDRDAFLNNKHLTWVEQKFSQFFSLLKQSEEDCSVVIQMVIQDQDCCEGVLPVRVYALLDYIEIALAIYSAGDVPHRFQVLH